MAPRIRTLKPELPESQSLARCSRDARLLFVLLITQADDEGRFRASPALIRAKCYPYDDDVTTAMVTCWMEELEAVGHKIRRYTVDGQDYGDIPSWADHQKINRPTPSRLPSFEDSLKPHGNLSDPSVADLDRGPWTVDHVSGTDVPSSDSTSDAPEPEPPSPGNGRSSNGARQPVPVEEMQEVWNQRRSPALPAVRALNPARRSALAAMWREIATAQRERGEAVDPLPVWERAVAAYSASPHHVEGGYGLDTMVRASKRGRWVDAGLSEPLGWRDPAYEIWNPQEASS